MIESFSHFIIFGLKKMSQWFNEKMIKFSV